MQLFSVHLVPRSKDPETIQTSEHNYEEGGYISRSSGTLVESSCRDTTAATDQPRWPRFCDRSSVRTQGMLSCHHQKHQKECDWLLVHVGKITALLLVVLRPDKTLIPINIKQLVRCPTSRPTEWHVRHQDAKCVESRLTLP